MRNTYLLSPSEKELVSEMHHKGSVLNGWDAVINITQDLINANLAKTNKNIPFIESIPDILLEQEFPGGITVFTKFSAKLCSPSVNFYNNDKTVDILTNIESADFQKGTKIGDAPITWGEKKKMPQGSYIKNSIKYETLTEGSTISLFISLSESSAALFGADADIDIASLNEKLSEYLKGLDLKYYLLHADLSAYNSVFNLGNIEVNTSITSSNTTVVHLFAAAFGNVKLQPYLSIDNCISVGCCSSVILHSKYVFKNMLIDPLNASGTLQFQIIDPKNNYEAFHGSAKAYTIEEKVDFSQRPDLRITPTSNLISFDLEGMELGSTDYSGICFKLKKTILQDYQIHLDNIPLWKPRTITLDIEVKSELPLVVSHEKEETEIKLNFNSLSLKVSKAKAQEQCTSDEFSTFASPFQKAIEDLLASQIKNTDFSKAPALADKNVLPAMQTQLTKAYIPGDLLLLISLQE